MLGTTELLYVLRIDVVDYTQTFTFVHIICTHMDSDGHAICFCQLLHPSMCEAYCRCLYALRGRLVKRSTVGKSKIKER